MAAFDKGPSWGRNSRRRRSASLVGRVESFSNKPAAFQFAAGRGHSGRRLNLLPGQTADYQTAGIPGQVQGVLILGGFTRCMACLHVAATTGG